MREKPICLQKTIVAKSRLFTIEEMHLQFSNGEKRIFERIPTRGFGSVLVIALTAHETLLLVKEYASGTDSYELGFPKGIIEKGETIFQAANRELQEEVGFAAKEFHFIKRVTLAPAYFAANMEIVFARELYPSRLQGDEPEPPELVEWPLYASDELLQRPDFTEARSIAALLLIKQWLKREV